MTWDYNARSGRWLRGQNGTADVDSAHQQVDAANVVVLFVPYITSGIASGEGVAPVPIPEGILTGSGQAWFLSQGKLVKGTWRATIMTSVAQYRSLRAPRSGSPRAEPGSNWSRWAPPRPSCHNRAPGSRGFLRRNGPDQATASEQD